MGTWWSMVGNGYLVVQLNQRVPRVSWYAKVTLWSKVGKGFLVVHGMKRIPNGPKYSIGSGPWYPKGT